MTHFNKYRNSEIDVVDDFRQYNQARFMQLSRFMQLLTPEVIKSLFRKRNNAHGGQYAIVDLFKKEFVFYYSLFFDCDLLISSKDVFYRNRSPIKVNVRYLQTMFPAGLPQTEKQLASWLSYIGWVASQKFK